MNPRFLHRDFDPAAARRLQESGIPAALARALAARGVASEADLQLRTREIHPPSALTHVELAGRLLADAIGQGQRLLVVADYDCDGATACAVAVRGLRALGADVDFLVPNRFETGYGLTPEVVDLALRHRAGKPDWIITVDNGIASIEGVDRANELGIAVLVTDHHLPGERLPAARAIVNPNQPDCGFPSKNLAGVGVMFYVLMQLRAELRARGRFSEADQPRLDVLLDLVALGTVADLVRLDRNNRILVQAGLERIRRAACQPGLLALFRIAGREARKAVASDLGFALGPRINAAGRLTDMTLGIECLLADNFDRADQLALRLDEINRERRRIESTMQAEAEVALAGADAQISGSEFRRTITLHHEDWHQGVVGLIASRIKERHHRPTIAFACADGDWLRGSGRSIEGVHLRDALDRVTKTHPGLIAKFGGHAMAAGLTISRSALEPFIAAFEAAVRETTDPALYAPTLVTDGPLAVEELTPTLVQAIDGIVWGQGFPPPLFADEFEILDQRILKDAHLQLTVKLGERRLRAMWFRHAETLPPRARLAYRPVFDEYQGVARISLFIERQEG